MYILTKLWNFTDKWTLVSLSSHFHGRQEGIGGNWSWSSLGGGERERACYSFGTASQKNWGRGQTLIEYGLAWALHDRDRVQTPEEAGPGQAPRSLTPAPAVTWAGQGASGTRFPGTTSPAPPSISPGIALPAWLLAPAVATMCACVCVHVRAHTLNR